MHKNNFIFKTVPMPEDVKDRFMEYINALCREDYDNRYNEKIRLCMETVPVSVISTEIFERIDK